MLNRNFESASRDYVQEIEKTLEMLLPESSRDFADGEIPGNLCRAMRYSLLAGGKRIRPMLLLAVSDMLCGSHDNALVPAAALEMIHTYSLIHDDLPGMDNDDLRRGKPTNHVVFGEGQAILAGDGLLNYAYECMLKEAMHSPAALQRSVKAISCIASAAGVTGMIAGQCIDLLSEHQVPSEDILRYIHTHKTADLLTAPLLAAAALCGATEEEESALRRYGLCVGIAFQIDDDLLDVTGDAAILGKKTGMDAEREKMTWPSLVGVEAARNESKRLWQEAEDALSIFGESAWFLKKMAENLSGRQK